MGTLTFMNSAEARTLTETSCRLMSNIQDDFRREITRYARQGFSNIIIPYRPDTYTWDKKAFDSLKKEGYKVDLYPIDDEKPPTKAVISW